MTSVPSPSSIDTTRGSEPAPPATDACASAFAPAPPPSPAVSQMPARSPAIMRDSGKRTRWFYAIVSFTVFYVESARKPTSICRQRAPLNP